MDSIAKKAVMYGAGNIGRGFIGQLFSLSGYEVVFLDINTAVINGLNSARSYPVRIVRDDGFTDVTVGNVRGVNTSDSCTAVTEIASADIMATAVGVNVLPRIISTLALGLKKRWESGNLVPLNIIICENLLDADHYLEKLIKQELDDSEKVLFDKTVGLVEASIGRMVPVMTPEMQGGNLLRICVEEYCELPVDKDAFKGEIPHLVNMVPFSPFDFYIHRKLFMHNMGHATAAYLGFINGCTFIWEACNSSAIKLVALRALHESAAAISCEHGVPLQSLLVHAEDLLYRFGNKLLGDTIDRVGKDPVRKLSENDRLVGAARLCLKHGINPVNIAVGLAAGFMFAPEGDEAASRIQETLHAEGIRSALEKYCGFVEDDPLASMVEGLYSMLKSGSSVEDILVKAEKLKRV